MIFQRNRDLAGMKKMSSPRKQPARWYLAQRSVNTGINRCSTQYQLIR